MSYNDQTLRRGVERDREVNMTVFEDDSGLD